MFEVMWIIKISAQNANSVCNSKYLVYFLQVPFKNFDFYDLQVDIQESVREEIAKFSFLKG